MLLVECTNIEGVRSSLINLLIGLRQNKG